MHERYKTHSNEIVSQTHTIGWFDIDSQLRPVSRLLTEGRGLLLRDLILPETVAVDIHSHATVLIARGLIGTELAKALWYCCTADVGNLVVLADGTCKGRR